MIMPDKYITLKNGRVVNVTKTKSKPTLPSKKINIANGRPDQYLTKKEPEKITIGKWTMENQFPKGTHSYTAEGHLTPRSLGNLPGIFHSKGFKHPTSVPNTMRGFKPSTEEFDIWTDHYGNVMKTRQGTPTYNGGDIQATENGKSFGSVDHTGKQFLGNSDLRSRTPLGNKKLMQTLDYKRDIF